MVGLITSREPIRGKIARQLLEHIEEMTAARAAGTIKRVQSPHKTNIQLIEAANV